ncbi:hypothetical protein M3212_12330 [Alkalihalobacillus oceani]|uniref:hypothetical protein n=1 Tax=Halalkalibacter oceani TaxID=1653776 RepID=UPI00203CDD0C|nr:hypothetical protein [Halalkalibacter oceani]MCM3761573.1 hypothetical protein [Halalkalibacter oceani]
MLSHFTTEEAAGFQAYTRLTVTAHVKAKREGADLPYKQAPISFKDFLEMIDKDVVGNHFLSREIDQWQQEHSDLQKRMGGDPQREKAALGYLEKAYHLGIVDKSGHLYTAKA